MGTAVDPRASLVQMFEAFAPRVSDRWIYLLSRDPRKWDKITPIKIWPGGDVFASIPNKPIPELLASPPLRDRLDDEVVVLRCGHSREMGLSVMRVVFEGFVSVVPGKLAIGLNHEGGVCVFGV